MAVNEAMTPAYARVILHHLNPITKKVAFTASNPILASALEHVSTEPGRIKKLAVSSAVELVELLEDISVLREIARKDQRSSVQASVESRLRERNAHVQISKKVSPQGSPDEQLAVLTSKKFTTALNSLCRQGNRMDVKVAADWVLTLDESQAMIATERLFASPAFYGQGSESARNSIERFLLQKVTTEASKEHWGSLYLLPKNIELHLSELTGEISGFLATQISRVYDESGPRVRPKDGAPSFVASADAIKVWKDEDATHLLVWTQSIDADKAAKMMKRTDIKWCIPAHAATPAIAQVLIEKAISLNWFNEARDFNSKLTNRWWHGRPETALGRLYEVPGLPIWIQKEIAFLAEDSDLRAYLFNQYPNKLDEEVLEHIVSTFDADTVESLFDPDHSYDRYSINDEDCADATRQVDPTHLAYLVEAFVKGVKGLPAALQPSNYSWKQASANPLYPYLAQYLSDVLGNNARAWATFWSLVANASKEITFGELASVSAALAE